MRIRSIRPEFWSSEDIAALNWEQRLIYIGLWSYVDDNGVGRDSVPLIAAALFPYDEDREHVSVSIHGALSEYSSRKMITRYTVSERRFLHVTAWDTHQKINRPSSARYPLPTRADTVIHEVLTEPSVSPQAESPLGEGEKGRRGEEEKHSPATRSDNAAFTKFWELYPKKRNKRTAQTKWATVTKKTPSADILAGLHRSIAYWDAERTEVQFIPAPDVWLNKGSWEDELTARRNGSQPPTTPDDGPNRAANMPEDWYQ